MMKKARQLLYVCPNCKNDTQYRTGYIECIRCGFQADLLETSRHTVCRCLAPHIRTIANRTICIGCGGRIERTIAKKPTKKQLAAFIEF